LSLTPRATASRRRAELVKHAPDLEAVDARKPAQRLLMRGLPFWPLLRKFHLDDAVGPPEMQLRW